MIIIKTPKEIEIMKKGGHALAEVVREVSKLIKPGIQTLALDQAAERLILKRGARPSFKNYEGYPNTICASLNDEVVHAIPSESKIIKDGDIVGLDIGLEMEGLFTDMAVTVIAGRVAKRVKKLVQATKKALELGLLEIKPGNCIGDISYAIQRYAESKGFSVVRDLVGHGVGRAVHEAPRIPNFGQRKTGPMLEPGMTLAIEPMVTAGACQITTDPDGWTVRTKDGSLSAHFEVTVALTERGLLVLTK